MSGIAEKELPPFDPEDPFDDHGDRFRVAMASLYLTAIIAHPMYRVALSTHTEGK